jgi:GNAT superfamily N-acetyltransferase
MCGIIAVMTMENVVIREAYETDLEVMAKLSEQLGYPATVEEFTARFNLLKKGKHLVMVAELMDHGVVGWIHVMPRLLLVAGLYGEVGGIIVDQKHRRKGIGRALMETAEHWVLNSGCQGMIIRSDKKREGSHPFYKSSGYHPLKSQQVYIKRFAN